jgi:hypothetical protein
MSVQSIQAQLQRQVGGIIQNIHVEFWVDDLNTLAHPISVGIEVRNGASLILSCAGDGGIAVRKGQLEASTDNLFLRTLDRVQGMVIGSIECVGNSLTLSIRDHQIRIANHDDELEITVNGCDVKEFLDGSASP